MNRCLRSCCLAAGLLVPAIAHAQLPPDKAASTFTVADGLEMKLWASEPLFVNPTCIDVDHKGRVWVCESVNYRTKLHGKKLNRPKGDRIVILEDSKGSGKADKATTFYQSPELLAPLGIAVAAEPSRDRKGAFSYKVYVCQAPNILLFEDKDGDGKADGPPKKLLSGFGGVDDDHGVHGIFLGPDGKLYFSVGAAGVRGLQSSDGKGRRWTSNDSDCRAGTIWRCDLDGKNLERYAHNFCNPFEPCLDSFGTLFTSDHHAADEQQSRICYVMPGGDYGYQPRGPGQSTWHEEQPGVVPKILAIDSSFPAGLCVYEGTLLPKKYQGQLLHCDAGSRHVSCYHLTVNGAGYNVDGDDLVTSTDKWFRPIDVCTAPDGSVFIADWYDPAIGGNRMDDTTHGRIYRLAPKDHSPTVPKADLASKDGITAALASPCLAVRHLAIARLKALPAEEVKKTLDPAITQKDNPYLRARAFWQVYSRKGLPLQPARVAVGIYIVEPPDPRLSAMTLRLTKEAHGISMIYYLDEKFIKMIYALPAAARAAALLQLRDADSAKAKQHVREMALKYDGKDRIYLEAVGIAVGRDKARRDVILADFDKLFLEWDDRIGNLVWALQPPGMLPMLETRLGDGKLSNLQRIQVVDTLAAYDDKAAGVLLLKALQTELPAPVRRKIVVSLQQFPPEKWQYLRRSPELNAVIKAMLDKAESKATALDLIGASQKVEDAGVVRALAANKDEPEAVRRAAVRALGPLSEQKTNVRVAALAEKQLHDLVRAAGDNKVLAQAALETLANTYAGARWLLDLHDKKGLPQALRDDAGRLLRECPFPTLRSRAATAFPPKP